MGQEPAQAVGNELGIRVTFIELNRSQSLTVKMQMTWDGKNIFNQSGRAYLVQRFF